MQSMPTEDYNHVYATTGIDIDGRRNYLKSMIPSFTKACERYIKFTSEIHGFRNLPQKDQETLIKGLVLF